MWYLKFPWFKPEIPHCCPLTQDCQLQCQHSIEKFQSCNGSVAIQRVRSKFEGKKHTSNRVVTVIFTPPVGYSRPPSAVNDPPLTGQVNSENHASNKCPNHFLHQVSLINRCWVRLRGDSRKKDSTLILASSTKTKNSFASIFGCVELHLLCLLTVAKKTMLV